ncbi:MAG: hypothetical protein ACRD3D_04475 [Terriglobia bacterium]
MNIPSPIGAGRPASALVLAALLIFSSAAAGQSITRLYLKDGSYELVKTWQTEGNRVRYYSVERSQWEEVPQSLVDFAATRRSQAERQNQQKQGLEQAEKLAKDTYQLPPNTGVVIAPGVRLPARNGVYAYDGTRLVTLIQSRGSVEEHRTALHLVVPGAILKPRSLVILPGPAAGVRMLSIRPVFYVHLSGSGGANVQLLRLKTRKNDRVVEGLEYRSTGAAPALQAVVPLELTLVAPGIYKLQPAQPLSPGEYALAEADQQAPSLEVWDFGIDSTAIKPRR